MVTLYVNTDAGGGGNGSIGSPFNRCLDAVNSLPGVLASEYLIDCVGATADVPINQSPFDFTTTPTNKLTIRGNNRSMIYDPTKYHIEALNSNGLYNNIPSHLYIDAVQLQITVTNGGSFVGLKTTNANQLPSDIDCRVSNCIVKAVQTSGTVIGFNARYPITGIGSAVFWNCVAIDCQFGYNSDHPYAEFDNCGAYDCQYGFVSDVTVPAGRWMVVKNCLSKTKTGGIGFVGTFGAGSTNNCEDDGNGAPGTNPHSGTAFFFIDGPNDDFHITSSDTGAKGLGVTDPTGGLFSDDIDGDLRNPPWDVGPDQYVATLPPPVVIPPGIEVTTLEFPTPILNTLEMQ